MKNNNYDNYNFRPRIKEDLAEKLRRLSNDYNIETTKVVNFLIGVGAECMERCLQNVEGEIKQKIETLIKDFK